MGEVISGVSGGVRGGIVTSDTETDTEDTVRSHDAWASGREGIPELMAVCRASVT